MYRREILHINYRVSWVEHSGLHAIWPALELVSLAWFKPARVGVLVQVGDHGEPSPLHQEPVDLRDVDSRVVSQHHLWAACVMFDVDVGLVLHRVEVGSCERDGLDELLQAVLEGSDKASNLELAGPSRVVHLSFMRKLDSASPILPPSRR